MKKATKAFALFLIVPSIFMTGCDAEKILQAITNVSQAIQQSIPAIKEAVNSITGSKNGISSNGTTSKTSALSTSKPVAAETNQANKANVVVVSPTDEEIEISNGNAATVSSQAPNSTATIDSINDGNATVESTKAVIESLERALKAQEEYLKSHPESKEVAKGIERLKEEIKNRNQLLLELEKNQSRKTENTTNSKTHSDGDLSLEVKKQIKSNQHAIDSANSFLKEAQEKYEKYPNVKAYEEKINYLKNYINKLESENGELKRTNIATMGVIAESAISKDKRKVESNSSTKKEKIAATQRIISSLRLGLALQKENAKNHPANQDIVEKIAQLNSEIAKYTKVLSRLQSGE